MRFWPSRSGVGTGAGTGRVGERVLVLVGVGFCLGFLSGCGEDGDGEWTGEARDSAGVVIVENPALGLWQAEERWRVEEDLRIGEVAGEAAYQFGRLGDVAPLSDGRIVVLDAQARELRVFDVGGRHLRTMGGPGSGPGELGLALGALLVGAGDSIYVPDLAQQRVSRYTAEGEVLAGFPMPLDAGLAVRWGVTADGGLVQQSTTVGTGMPGASEPHNRILVRGSDGSASRTLLELEPDRSFEMGPAGPRVLLFSPQTIWAVAPDGRLVLARSDEYRLEILAPDGTLERVIRRFHPPYRITDADRAKLREVHRGSMAAMSGGEVPREVMDMLTALVEQMQFAERYPVIADVQFGPTGTVWVQQAIAFEEALRNETFDLEQLGSSDWDVFDDAGLYLGAVELPARFRLRRICGDALYGVLRGEHDVPYAVRLRLVRPAGNGAAGGAGGSDR